MLHLDRVTYDHSEHFELKEISMTISTGEIISLIGPNGSGKSTLLRLMARLLAPKEGSILLDGEAIHRMKTRDVAKQMAMLPQMHDHFLDLTVKELVEFGRYPHQKSRAALTDKDRDVVDWALEVTNMKGYTHRLLPSLSGGERQRAWISMAIAQQPNVLLLDEPTTYLDIAHQLEVMELVQQLNRTQNMTIIMVLHDINQAAEYSDELFVMNHGKIQYEGAPDQVMSAEMFQSVFHIDVDIHKSDGALFYKPKRMRKEEDVLCSSR
ncbi:ABC transporter ATP-binding protein [Bacillus sp. AK031]